MESTLSKEDKAFFIKLAKEVQENTKAIERHETLLKSLKTNKLVIEKTPKGIYIVYPDQVIPN